VNSRFPFLALLMLCAAALGQQAPKTPAQAGAPDHAPVLVLQGIGRGIAPIDGIWQFHLGDDPAWAQPSVDDSNWDSIHAGDYWGNQGYPSYTGFAWYRRHVQLVPTAGEDGKYGIAFPDAQDAYEVYWNGKLIGQYGSLPPHAVWFYQRFPQAFPLSGSNSGLLAVRVWKAPLHIFDSAGVGGIDTPLLGDLETIRLSQDENEWQIIRGDLFDYGLVLLRVFIAFLCLVLWYRNRAEHLFTWVAIYTATPVAIDIINRLFRIPLPWNVARGLNQPIYVLYLISMWFLLVWLLRLHDNRVIVRWTRALGWTAICIGIADGVLSLFWAHAGPAMQWANGILACIIVLMQVIPYVIIAIGLQRKQDTSRWAVAIGALLLQLIYTLEAATAFGRRFTHLSFFDFINNPLFSIQNVYFYPEKIVSLALFAAILFAVYRYAMEQQARQSVMEREMQSAREIQQVLVPDALPAIEGYAITSAYQPAMEVGGDFFQIIPNDDGSTIVALGDVSGKGLKAGMNVSMIVGVLRAEAGSTDPAQILAALNRCLAGRMAGGFATGMVFRIDQDGMVTFANAGHLPPYLNGLEYPLDASLPLGLIPYADYTEEKLQLKPGDQLAVYTDGLLEATSPTNELFGFDRMKELFAKQPTAQEAMQAALDFGQEDDITVLTITRLAAGVESTTSLAAPAMEPETAEA
jgi:Stage II sporulation protein E (SpoIIE)